MKILSLDLIAFGPFTDLPLVLGEGREGLHVIYGPNEAGKSSALRALRQCFFGIPSTSRDAFIHSFPNLRIGATVRTNDGSVLQFVRRKGNKNTLRDRDDDAVLDESLLRRFLSDTDEATFSSMFALDHQALVEGGRAIVEGDGDIGQILFAAGAGVANLRHVQNQLEREADSLFAPRSKRTINQAIADLDTARKQVREHELPSATWLKHQEDLERASSRKEVVERELERLQKQRNYLQRIEKAFPMIARRKTLLAEFDSCRDAVRLRYEFADERRDCQVKIAQAEADLKKATELLHKIDLEVASVHVPEPLLHREGAVEELHRRLGSNQKAALDRSTRLEPELAQFLAEARRILRELRPDLDLAQVDQIRLSAADRTRVRELGNRFQSLVARQAGVEEQIRVLGRRLEDCRTATAGSTPVRDHRAIRKSLESARRQGDLDDQLAAARRRLVAIEQQLGIDLKKLPLWFGTLAELEMLPVPPAEAIEDYRDRLGESDNELSDRRDRIRELQQRIIELDRQIDELDAASSVPTESELLQMRQRRERGWRLVRHAWETDDQDGPEIQDFVQDSAPGADLPQAYEAVVRDTDQISDRLRHEADRVARHAELEANRRQCSSQLEQLRADFEEATHRQADLQADWRRLWLDCEIEPLSPKQMEAWIRQQHTLVEQAKGLREQQNLVAELERRIEHHSSELDSCLIALGEPGKRAGDSLSDLISRATELVTSIDALAVQHRTLMRDQQKYEQDLIEARQLGENIAGELERWRTDWSDAIQPLGLRPNATPGEADAVLERITELFEQIRQAESHQTRIKTIQREADEFAGEVHRLVTLVQFSPTSDVPDRIAEELYLALTRGRAAKIERGNLMAHRNAELERIKNAREVIEQAATKLDQLCREAGCARSDELPAAEAHAERRRDIEQQIQQANEAIAGFSGGAGIDSFLSSAEAEQPDAIRPQIQRLESDIALLEIEKTELDQTIGAEKRSLASMDGGARAAQAAEELQQLIPKIQADTEQFVRLRLASRILQNAIVRYRDKNQGPILTHASQMFEELTLGSFESLRVDYTEDGKLVLMGLRSGGKATVHVDGMSEGTADQLYLALRLASLETFLESHEPLPFIVDDLLINFDNDRAAAALKLLGRLSQKTQVLFFTHHEHLVELARATVDDTMLFVHSLTPNHRLREPATKPSRTRARPSTSSLLFDSGISD